MKIKFLHIIGLCISLELYSTHDDAPSTLLIPHDPETPRTARHHTPHTPNYHTQITIPPATPNTAEPEPDELNADYQEQTLQRQQYQGPNHCLTCAKFSGFMALSWLIGFIIWQITKLPCCH